MTDEELDRLGALANAASPEPWKWRRVESENAVPEWTLNGCKVLCRYWDWEREPTNTNPDAEFLSASRTAIPALIAEVRRLKALNTEYARIITGELAIKLETALEAPND